MALIFDVDSLLKENEIRDKSVMCPFFVNIPV